MVHVSINLYPKGNIYRARNHGTITLCNTGAQTVRSRGDYSVQLSRRGRPESVLHVGHVRNFPRLKRTAYDLLLLALLNTLPRDRVKEMLALSDIGSI